MERITTCLLECEWKSKLNSMGMGLSMKDDNVCSFVPVLM